MSKTRLALIGTGRWGAIIKKTIASLSDTELLYEVTRDWQTLLDKDDIDGIIIAAPPASHAEIALPFIERGLPVFIEKPMTTSVADAKQIEMAAKKNNITVMVGHIHLYNPAFVRAKSCVLQSGPIRLLVGEGANNGPIRADYSAMWDWAPHDISMILDLVGEMPRSVEAWGIATLRPGTHIYDTSQIKLDFQNGIVGLIFSSWLMPQKRKRLTVVSEKSTVVYDDALPEKKVTLFEESGTKISSPDYVSGMPLTLELEAFVRAITKREEPRSGIAEGLKVVQILDAAERSIASGASVVL